jgi:hypothetical protein
MWRREWLATTGLVAWLIGGSLLGGLLLIRHLIALPTPVVTDRALRDTLRAELPGHDWRAVHIMYRGCACSRRTIDHLIATPRPVGVRELVVMVDDAGAAGSDDPRLRAAGFPVTVITPDALRARFHLEAAPVLVVMAPDDRLLYIGGYNRHKQSPAYEDLSILSELQARQAPPALPVFGCATSARLAHAVDPLNLTGRMR